MRTLLVPFHGSDTNQTALKMAHLVAARFGSYVEGLFVLQPPPIIAGEGITIPGEYLTQLAEEGRRLANEARERFERFMKERNVPFGDITKVSDTASANWREMEGLESQVIGEYGRLFDLIVVGCATQPSSADRNAICEAALFESGRPVMVSAEHTPATLGKTIVVAWNGSTETARTIALGMPLLQTAEKVVVLTVQGGTVPGPEAEQVTRHLVRNNVNAQTQIVELESRTVGEAILEETDRAGADLLLKGAFTHSRLRQLIFGGATQHILSNPKVPVFMAH